MDTLITTLVDGVLVPLIDAIVTPIPFLVSSGILLVVFAALWLALGVAIARDPARIDAAWAHLRRLPLPVQALAWLALLPVLAGVWVWRTGWPRLARLALVAGLASWNLLVFMPRPA